MTERLSSVVRKVVSRETVQRLEAYVALLLAENQRQNLIGRSSIDDIWERHIVDSAQLLPFVSGGSVLDIGSGAGLPGVVLAILSDVPITLVEPRRLRVEFLRHCTATLNLDHVTIAQAKAVSVSGKFDTITARAVAQVEELFASCFHLSHPGTIWVLPKGSRGKMELAEAQRSWQGRFRTEPSVTEGEAVIVVASNLSAKRKGRG
jgi:16S rRNA (guanine527-N7)-methyltransferase